MTIIQYMYSLISCIHHDKMRNVYTIAMANAAPRNHMTIYVCHVCCDHQIVLRQIDTVSLSELKSKHHKTYLAASQLARKLVCLSRVRASRARQTFLPGSAHRHRELTDMTSTTTRNFSLAARFGEISCLITRRFDWWNKITNDMLYCSDIGEQIYWIEHPPSSWLLINISITINMASINCEGYWTFWWLNSLANTQDRTNTDQWNVLCFERNVHNRTTYRKWCKQKVQSSADMLMCI